MAQKSIPDLDPVTSITTAAMFVVDTGTQTFKITAANLALFLRDVGTLIPPGTVNAYAGGAAPAGWLLCDGSAISRTTYVQLFTAIGTTFGVGNGSTTFNIPDLRGRYIAGKDNMGGVAALRITNSAGNVVGTTLGATGGSESGQPTGSITGTQSIAHVHTIAHTHQVAYKTASTGSFHMRSSSDPTLTSFTDSGSASPLGGVANTTGTTTTPTLAAFQVGAASYYSGGAISAASGSGASAASGGMSTNTFVNGSNFGFLGGFASRLGPTMIMNSIIKI